MRFIQFIASLALLLAAGGCVKDDNDCGQNEFLFSYMEDCEEECLLNYIGKVNVYVYDADGALFTSKVCEEEDLKARPGTRLDLPAGEYYFVCWGNLYGRSQVDKESRLQDAIIAPPRYFTGEHLITHDSLYRGVKKIEILEGTNQTETIEFSSAHVKMDVYLTGLEPSICGEELTPVNLYVNRVNPIVEFEESGREDRVSYLPVLDYDAAENRYIARFNLPRFPNENLIHLHLETESTGEVLYEMELKDFMSAYGIDVEDQQEERVAIEFQFNKTRVKVLPWEEEEIKPGL